MRKLLALAALVALTSPLAACRDHTADAGTPGSVPTVSTSSSTVEPDTPNGCETSKPRCN
jgi:hypothetical protein